MRQVLSRASSELHWAFALAQIAEFLMLREKSAMRSRGYNYKEKALDSR